MALTEAQVVNLFPVIRILSQGSEYIVVWRIDLGVNYVIQDCSLVNISSYQGYQEV